MFLILNGLSCLSLIHKVSDSTVCTYVSYLLLKQQILLLNSLYSCIVDAWKRQLLILTHELTTKVHFAKGGTSVCAEGINSLDSVVFGAYEYFHDLKQVHIGEGTAWNFKHMLQPNLRLHASAC